MLKVNIVMINMYSQLVVSKFQAQTKNNLTKHFSIQWPNANWDLQIHQIDKKQIILKNNQLTLLLQSNFISNSVLNLRTKLKLNLKVKLIDLVETITILNSSFIEEFCSYSVLNFKLSKPKYFTSKPHSKFSI